MTKLDDLERLADEADEEQTILNNDFKLAIYELLVPKIHRAYIAIFNPATTKRLIALVRAQRALRNELLEYLKGDWATPTLDDADRLWREFNGEENE